jgi:nitrite reductase/ring-hydroxylating ferredoxin subunit
MSLADLVTKLDLQIQPQERWAIAGPESEAFRPKLGVTTDTLLPLKPESIPQLDGLLLVGALSTDVQTRLETWLKEIIALLKREAELVVVDWQADGPLDRGPDLKYRFKKGRLCRLLREAGFGLIETLVQQPYHYIIEAIKGDPPAPPLEFVDVAGLEELPKNSMKPVELFGRQVVIANTGKEIVAFTRTCPHANSALDGGLLRRRSLVCPQHGYIWDVCTGEPIEPDDEDTLSRYTVQIDREGQRILVALTPPPEESY